MRVITQNCVLLLWMYTLTFVKSQDCTLEQFLNSHLYDSNFDVTDLDSSYPSGRQVSVNCNVGFSGFFKLTCVQGRWESRGTKCQPRSCGHPGDAQFAEFHLAEGDDFVFGSKVEYTCHKGYQMITPKNYRYCMADGWDGVVPVCERPVVCGTPPPLAYGDIRNSVKSQYSHNERVEYMCALYYTMEGEPYRTCINGEWIGQQRCLKPCVVDKDNLGQHNITLKSGSIIYYTHDDIIEFKCARGIPVGAVAMRQRCNSGVILLPTCQ